MLLFTVFRPPYGRHLPPQLPRSPATTFSRVRSRRVWRTLQQNHNESVFFLYSPIADSLRKNSNSIFLENLSSHFRKMLHEHAPHPALSKHITTNPPPELGAGPGSPKVGDDPPKISHFRFPGVGIFTTISSARRSPQKLGV